MENESRLTRDGTTAEPVSRDKLLRRERGQGKFHFSFSVDHELDWQPYPVDPYSAICHDHTRIHIYIEQQIIINSRTGPNGAVMYNLINKSMDKTCTNTQRSLNILHYEGNKERRTGKIRGAFSRMHEALDG